jgi:uncharacterized membrane protein YphA (DoxX/SURF4 family)
MMSTREKGYWTATSLVVFALLAGGMGDVMRLKPVAEGMKRIGYPLYFLTIVGTWKILGGFALVWPGMPRLREWAYAGVFFVMTGAAISHAVCGEVGYVFAPTLLAILGMLSWKLQPEGRLPSLATPGANRIPSASPI